MGTYYSSLRSEERADCRRPTTSRAALQLLHSTRRIYPSTNRELSMDLCTFAWILSPVVYSEKSQEWRCDSVYGRGAGHLWIKGRILVESDELITRAEI